MWVLQVRAGPNQPTKPKKPIKQELKCGYSVKNTIQACVPRYFRVGILILFKANIVFT